MSDKHEAHELEEQDYPFEPRETFPKPDPIRSETANEPDSHHDEHDD